MERVDLLYSGLLVAAFILTLWTAFLLTATFVFFAPAFRFASIGPRMAWRQFRQNADRAPSSAEPDHPPSKSALSKAGLSKSAPAAATIASTLGYVPPASSPTHSLSEAIPPGSGVGKPLRVAHSGHSRPGAARNPTLR